MLSAHVWLGNLTTCRSYQYAGLNHVVTEVIVCADIGIGRLLAVGVNISVNASALLRVNYG